MRILDSKTGALTDGGLKRDLKLIFSVRSYVQNTDAKAFRSRLDILHLILGKCEVSWIGEKATLVADGTNSRSRGFTPTKSLSKETPIRVPLTHLLVHIRNTGWPNFVSRRKNLISFAVE